MWATREREVAGDEWPTVLVYTKPLHWWIAAAFARYANVVHVAVDMGTRSMLARRLLVRWSIKYVGMWAGRIASKLLKTRLVGGLPPRVDLVVYVDMMVPIARHPRLRHVPHILWSHDSHVPIGFKMHLAYVQSGMADRVYATHPIAVKRFKEHGVDARHLPYALDPLHFYPRRPVAEPRPFFVGNPDPKRERIIKELNTILEKRGLPKVLLLNAYFHDYAELVSEKLLGLNITRRGELNWRVFEVMGARGLLINEDIPEVREMFVDGEHLVLWSSVEELADIIEEMLNDTEKALRIARRGCRLVWEKHTIDHRVCQILRDAGWRCEPRPPNREVAERECVKAS